MRFVSRLLLVGAAIVVSLVVTDLVLRVFVERPSLVSEWVHASRALRDVDVIFLPPGLRSDDHYESRGASTVIVTMGDSFTEGHPVAPSDAYPAVLEGLLDARGLSAKVIDMGIGDTGPDQHLRVFEREVLRRLTPNIVVWQFFPNDEWDNLVKATYRIEANELVPLDVKQNWLYRRQRFYDAVPLNGWLLRNSLIFRFMLRGAERWQTSALPSTHLGEARLWGTEKIALAVERMKNLGHKHGFRPYFALVAPQAAYLGPEEQTPKLRAFLRGYNRMLAILRDEPDFLHVRFDVADGDNPSHSFFVGADRDPLELGSRHFNETGYRLFAEQVFARLVSDGALTSAPASPSSHPSPARSSPGA
jgi:hypothetical protein